LTRKYNFDPIIPQGHVLSRRSTSDLGPQEGLNQLPKCYTVFRVYLGPFHPFLSWYLLPKTKTF